MAKNTLQLNAHGIVVSEHYPVESCPVLHRVRYASEKFTHEGTDYVVELQNWQPCKEQLELVGGIMGEQLELGERVMSVDITRYDEQGLGWRMKYDGLPGYWMPQCRPVLAEVLATINRVLGTAFDGVEVLPW